MTPGRPPPPRPPPCWPAARRRPFKSPDDAVEYRQGALAVMGHHFGLVGAMANGKIPFDAQGRAGQRRPRRSRCRTCPGRAFVEGSDKGDTSARPEVWSQPDKFKAAAQKLQDAAAKLAAGRRARPPRPDDLKAAFSATADTCKSCHDDFRKKHH